MRSLLRQAGSTNIVLVDFCAETFLIVYTIFPPLHFQRRMQQDLERTLC